MAKIVKIESHKNWKGTKIKKDWSKEPHHPQCCCDKCAPTMEEVNRRVEEFENLAPSDCEP
jgi:hypothetical protein